VRLDACVRVWNAALAEAELGSGTGWTSASILPCCPTAPTTGRVYHIASWTRSWLAEPSRPWCFFHRTPWWLISGTRASPSWDQVARTASPSSYCSRSSAVLVGLGGQDPGGLALYTGEGDYSVPAISDCRLILYKARPEICGRGSCICWKLFNFSSPRTRASRFLRYKNRTHV